jgi:hypothetical protein
MWVFMKETKRYEVLKEERKLGIRNDIFLVVASLTVEI